jgi:hypothetical protein
MYKYLLVFFLFQNYASAGTCPHLQGKWSCEASSYSYDFNIKYAPTSSLEPQKFVMSHSDNYQSNHFADDKLYHSEFIGEQRDVKYIGHCSPDTFVEIREWADRKGRQHSLKNTWSLERDKIIKHDVEVLQVSNRKSKTELRHETCTRL